MTVGTGTRFPSWIRHISDSAVRWFGPPGEVGIRHESVLAGWLWVVAAGLVTVVASLFTLRRFHGFDVLWHVRTGQWILANGRVPQVDPFGEITGGTPWIEVPWAADVIMALVVRATDFLGLQILAAILVAASLALCLRWLPRTPLVIWAAALTVLVCWQRFLPRPDLLSMPLLMTLLVLTDRSTDPGRRDLKWIALLAVAWCNLHGSFIIVPLVLGAALAGTLLRRRPARNLLFALLLVLAAPLVSPYGVRLYLVLEPYVNSVASMVGLADTRRLTIIEWRPTWQALAGDLAFPLWPLVLLTLALALSFVRAGRRICLSRLLQALLLLGLGLTAVRHLLLYGVAALVFIGLNERDLLAAWRASRGEAAGSTAARAPRQQVAIRVLGAAAPAGAILLLLVVAVGIVTDRYYVARDLPIRTGVGIDIRMAPEGAAVWLAANEPPGRVFNNFDSGAYLHHRLYPHFRPYLDARLVDADQYFRVRDAVADARKFTELVEQDGIGTIVLAHPSPETFHLLPRLAADAGWELAFRDRNSTVHVRADGPPPRPRLSEVSLDSPLHASQRRINQLLSRLKTHTLPAGELTDALVSRMLGQRRREIAAYRRAYAKAPENERVRSFFTAHPGMQPDVGEP